MFNVGTLAMPNLRGWNPTHTPLDRVTLSNARSTATLSASSTQGKSFKAIRGVASGTLTWWITLDAGQDVCFGVVGAGVTELGDEDGDSLISLIGQNPSSTINMVPSLGWYNLGADVGEMILRTSSLSGQGSSREGQTTPVGGTVRLTMDADSKRLTLVDSFGSTLISPVSTFELDQGPWYPACTLVAASTQVTISFTDPT